MASKYAHLPGLAVDQPDVFESIPNRDMSLVDVATPDTCGTEASTSEIERTRIDAKSAFDRFRDRRSVADFTAGLQDGSTVVDETIAEMLARLTRETRVLGERIKEKKERSEPFQGKVGDDETMSATEMAEELRLLETRLNQLSTESSILGVRSRAHDTSSIDAEDLLARLEKFKEASFRSGADSNGRETKEGGCVQYELSYDPHRMQFNHESRVVALESRLTQLERVVGTERADIKNLIAAVSEAGPLVTDVAELREQVSAMTAEGVAVAERRLVTLVSHFEKQLQSRGSEQLDAQTISKVEELYSLMHQWDSVARSVPLVADRLVALRKVHDDAARAAQALKTVESAHAEIKATVSEHKHVLKEMAANLEDNMKQSLTNFEALGDRLCKVEQALKGRA